MGIWVVDSSKQKQKQNKNKTKTEIKLKQNFQNRKEFLAKLHSLWQINFVLTFLFVLTLTSDMSDMFCTEMMRFQSQCFQLKSGNPDF